MRVTRTRVAERQIGEALRWWRLNRTGAPSLLRSELRLAYQIVSVYPEAGAPLDDPDLIGVRRIVLPRTRYLLFYRPLTDRIVVVGLWHQSRGSEPHL